MAADSVRRMYEQARGVNVGGGAVFDGIGSFAGSRPFGYGLVE